MMHEALVLGGGVVGLSAAYHLARRGLRVCLVEQHRLGHARGSSHGASRITRSSYADAVYVDLMRVANGEDWPSLEADAGEPLIRRMPGVFFGPRGGQFDAFAARASEGVTLVSRAVASARFPELRLSDDVLVDTTAGVIRADATCAALARAIVRMQGTILEETRVDRIDEGDPIVLHTSRGPLVAERLVVAAGPWTPRLWPALATHLRPLRQDVGYFEVPRALGFVFVYLGATSDELRYVLPADGGAVLKAARHRTAGAVDDPDASRAASEGEVDEVEAFLRRALVEPPPRRVGSETCFYTCTPSEDYVLDRHPGNPRIAIGAGFSGHGFKLAPTCGRVLADLVTDGRSFDAFERARAQFALP